MGKSILKVSVCALIYLALAFLGSSSGLIHPACFAYAGTVLAFLWSFIYFYAAANWQRFGVATIMNAVVLAACLILGEGNVALYVILGGVTVLSELIRFLLKYDTIRGTVWSYIPMGLSFFGYVAHWWTETEGSLEEALEEMPEGYALKMENVINSNIGIVMAVIIALILGYVGITLAQKLMKKQAVKLA